jgi:hypothetical protein
MVSLKLENFGGMVPAVSDYYLPPNQAALSENAWVYTGALEGFKELRDIYTCSSDSIRKVFRIPLGFYDKARIPNSYWMEFSDPDTDVVRSPIANDSFERFYWASNIHPPYYNPKSRITASKKSETVTVTIASPAVATLVAHGLAIGDPVYFTTTGALPTGITASQNYFVTATPTVDTFRFSSIPGGTDVNTSGTQSGTHTLYLNQPLKLGVPAPSVAPTLSVAGGASPTETRVYIYTWVTEYGEEGPPSPASAVTTDNANGTWTVTVTNPSNSDAAERRLKTVRIYRAVTAVTGVATYFYVGQISVGTTTYADSTVNVSANNQLESLYWSAPPTDLKGIIAMPNGIVAGFRSNEVYFCEPYRPHAWPVAYSLSVDYPIIGLGVIGQTLVACTSVSPYAISGVNPASMSMSRVSVVEPCMSRGSIVSTSAAVLYAAPEGLVGVNPGGAQNMTRELITKDKWEDFLPLANLRGAVFNDGYYCWGSQQGVVFQTDTFEVTAFQQADLTGGYTGAQIDFLNTRIAYNKLSTNVPALNVFSDVWTGEVFILKYGKVYWQDNSVSRPAGSYKWRSKIISMPNRRNLEAMRVWFDLFPDSPTLNPVRNTNLVQTLQADQWGLVRLYADETLVMCRELRTDGELMRLPSGFKASNYQVEIEARVRIISIEASTSAKELINV